jgi:uncharacterized protein YidB (DUF937 family)
MFEEILKMVKEHLGNNPEVSAALPGDQADAVHKEVATHINNSLQNQQAGQGGIGGMVSNFENSLGSGNILTSAISGGLVASLANKFGLPASVTGAIAAALPGIMQKVAHRNTETNNAGV